MPCERILKFDQLKIFSENYQQYKSYDLFTKLPRIIVAWAFMASSFELVEEIDQKLCNERALNTREPCT